MDDDKRIKNCRYHVPYFCKGIKGPNGSFLLNAENSESNIADVCTNDSNDKVGSTYYRNRTDGMLYSSIMLSRMKMIIERLEDNDEWEKLKVICPEDCDKCDCYKSMFIEFPLTVNNIKVEAIDMNDVLGARRIGRLCAVRPCMNDDKTANKKTYLGIYLGDQPWHISVSYNDSNKELNVSPIGNPAIYVPDLRKIVRGASSWWKFIESEEELSDITDDDIDSQFYVMLAKKYFGEDDGKIKPDSI